MNIKHKFNKDKLWFTSDNHFFHENIIKYCNRPYVNIENMHEVMIDKWNFRVKPDDDIVIAGDFIHTGNLEKIKSILEVLNGRKWLVYGNHCVRNGFDRKAVVDMFDGRCYDAMDFKVEDNELEDGFMKFHISHYPCEFWTRGAVHLHGHIHSGPLSTSREICAFNPLRYDIGVDNNFFEPVRYEMIKIIITKQILTNKVQ